MQRNIDDKDYIAFLPGEMFRGRYYRWRERMLKNIANIVADFERYPVDEVMDRQRLTFRDIALLVRLNYLTPEEVERFDLRKIEQALPE